MNFIKPSEISSKIMSLIEESDEFVFLVSPYVKISKWYKLLKKLDALKERKVPFQFIVRDDPTNHKTFAELDQFRLPYTAIQNLHCKVYLNEKTAIVTSMNILLSSEINSLEIGYETATPEEYAEVREYCERYLKIDSPASEIETIANLNFREVLIEKLRQKIEGNVNLIRSHTSYELKTSINNYTCFIWNSKTDRLVITGIISEEERKHFLKYPYKSKSFEALLVETIEGRAGHYSIVHATLQVSLSAGTLDDLPNAEIVIVTNVIADFVADMDRIKIRLKNWF